MGKNSTTKDMIKSQVRRHQFNEEMETTWWQKVRILRKMNWNGNQQLKLRKNGKSFCRRVRVSRSRYCSAPEFRYRNRKYGQKNDRFSSLREMWRDNMHLSITTNPRPTAWFSSIAFGFLTFSFCAFGGAAVIRSPANYRFFFCLSILLCHSSRNSCTLRLSISMISADAKVFIPFNDDNGNENASDDKYLRLILGYGTRHMHCLGVAIHFVYNHFNAICYQFTCLHLDVYGQIGHLENVCVLRNHNNQFISLLTDVTWW